MDTYQIIKIALNFPGDFATVLWSFSEDAGIGIGDAAPFVFGLMIDASPVSSFDPYPDGSIGSEAWKLGFKSAINRYPIEQMNPGGSVTQEPFMLGYQYGLSLPLDDGDRP